MPYNLIEEPWIPVRRESGDEAWVRPWELTDHVNGASPIVALNAPRPDFDGALVQFLIGLVQTALGPQDDREWRQRLQDPPPPAELRESFSACKEAFDLDGDTPRFLQDYGKVPEPTSEDAISHLLLNVLTGTTLDMNKDHFVKRREEDAFCPACTAAALYTRQAHTFGKGSGRKSSLRGGGPVTTVVLGRNLWHTVWLNVLPRSSADLGGISDAAQLSDVFPWLAPTRTSEDDTGTDTMPHDVHSLQVFWGMSRRIYLESSSKEEGTCDLCGRQRSPLFDHYREQPHGVKYEGSWKHPLTPHERNSDGEIEAKQMKDEGTSYPHWLGFCIGGDDKDVPAQVVTTFYDRGSYSALDSVFDGYPRLWIFGFETHRISKIKAWHESRMPLFQVSDQVLSSLERFAGQLVDVANMVIHNSKGLKITILKALYYKPSRNTSPYSKKKITWKGERKYPKNDRRKKETIFNAIEERFWQDTEPAFYETLDQGVEAIREGETLDELKRDWVKRLRRAALNLFDETTQYGRFHTADPKAVAVARQELSGFASPRSKQIRQTLDLPKPETTAAS